MKPVLKKIKPYHKLISPLLKIETESSAFEVWSVFALLFILSGLLGNFLLVGSVTYSKMKKRNNFDDSQWMSSTIILLNVAVVDMLYCLFALGNAAYGTYVKQHYWSDDWDPDSSFGICKFLDLGRKNLATIDGWSTAAISFNAAFPKLW